jgi:hypothetical protein
MTRNDRKSDERTEGERKCEVKIKTKTDVKTKVTKNIFRLTKDKKNVMIRAWMK